MFAGLIIETRDVIETAAQRRRQPELLADLLIGLLQRGPEHVGAGEVAVAELVVLEVRIGRDRLEVEVAKGPVERQHEIFGLVITEVAIRGSYLVLDHVSEVRVGRAARQLLQCLQNLVVLESGKRAGGGRRLIDDFDVAARNVELAELGL